MKHSVCLGLAAAILAAVSCAPVQAQPKTTVTYSYYAVSGDTLRDIYRSMVRSSPSVNGTRGFGITLASPGRQMNVASCRATGRYQLGMSLNIKLPRVVDTGGLTASEVSQWNRFSQFVRTHEDTHKAIWLACAADLERKFLAGPADDCGSSHARAMKLWKEMVSACQPKQAAFDAAQRGVVKAHPFMKYASR